MTATNIFKVLPTRWRAKSTGIDREQNYVTVTLCIDWVIIQILYATPSARVKINKYKCCTFTFILLYFARAGGLSVRSADLVHFGYFRPVKTVQDGGTL